MPLDGICMQAVAEELRPELLGLRIDKVQQPARDQVILLLRGNKRLLLNAGANAPRIQLTALTRDNPAEPPMFCMLLRKHLVGGRVAAVTSRPWSGWYGWSWTLLMTSVSRGGGPWCWRPWAAGPT